MKTLFSSIFAIILTITVSGCSSSSGEDENSDNGGGGSNNDQVSQGQFVDSVVIGLRYTTPTQSGFTNSQGQFNYIVGETVSFFVGDILIGTALGQVIITPIELVISATDETNIQVQNIVIFLQTIDEDGDESNGINITTLTHTAATGITVDFTLSSIGFDSSGAVQTIVSNLTSVNGEARSLVVRSVAISIFNSNLLVLFTGDYQGTFTGDDTGTFLFSVSNAGIITGQFTSNIFGTDTISGSIDSDGQSTISGTAGDSTFSGIFNRDGSLSGTYSDGEDGGTFTGQRTTDISIPGAGLNTEPDTGLVDITETDRGSLSLEGNDTSAIGTLFEARARAIVATGFDISIVAWTNFLQNPDDTVTIVDNSNRAITLLASFNGSTGELSQVTYSTIIISDIAVQGFIYSLDCSEEPTQCNSILVDTEQRQINFSNTILNQDIDSESIAIGPLSLNGTLNY